MKYYLLTIILYFIFPLLFFNCISFGSDIPNITVINNSDFDVHNITLTHSHLIDKKTINIELLNHGESITISVILQDRAIQTYMSGVDIEYYINGIRFDINNDENVLFDSDNKPYSSLSIGSEWNIKFIIMNDSYRAEMYKN